MSPPGDPRMIRHLCRQNGQSGELVEAPGHRKWGSRKPSGEEGEQALLVGTGMAGWLQHELRKRERELAAARVQVSS